MVDVMAREAATTRRLMGRSAQILGVATVLVVAAISLGWYGVHQYLHPVRHFRVAVGWTAYGEGTTAPVRAPQWHGSMAGFDRSAHLAVVGRVERFSPSYDQSEEPTMRVHIDRVLHDDRRPQLLLLTFPAQLVERGRSRWRLDYSGLERTFAPGTRVLVGVDRAGRVIELGSLSRPDSPLERQFAQ